MVTNRCEQISYVLINKKDRDVPTGGKVRKCRFNSRYLGFCAGYISGTNLLLFWYE
jgi:hypothetical protein